MAHKLNEEQLRAYNKLKCGKNVFLTGQAGVGKSYIIKIFKNWCYANNKQIHITATTGIAALIIGGCTVYSWASVGTGEAPVEKLIGKVLDSSFALKRWRKTDILVIDEVSMLSPMLLEKLNTIGQTVRRNKKPFGGIQVILSGDFLQLPVVKCTRYCFESDVWDDIINDVIELKQIMRQTDPIFTKCLEEIRFGKCSDETNDILMDRINKTIGENGIKPTELYPHNASVDYINQVELDKLKEIYTPKTFKSQIVINSRRKISDRQRKMLHDMINKNSQAVDNLELTIDTQVMIIANLDVPGGIVNGSRGVVTGFDRGTGYPIVKLMNGKVITMTSHAWTIDKDDGIEVSKMQIPLKLAYSATIHRSQGQTIDCCIMDLGSKIFDYGQTYTALSRVKSLDSLSLLNFNRDKIKANKKALEFYAKY